MIAVETSKPPIMACNEAILASNPRGDGPAESKTTASATGTIRNKVALKPGHSLLNWIKLGHSGKDLTGVGGVYQTVTLDELAKHNKRDDAWIAIKGQVFNVTHYLEFHPGGPEELLKGVGMDATKLFNEVHAWVNVESMLQKCLVGQLKQSKGESKIQRSREGLSSLLFSRLKKNESPAMKNGESVSGKEENTQPNSKPPGLPSPLLDWFQKPESFTLIIYTKRPGFGDSAPSLRVILKEELKLEVKLRVVKNGIFFSCTLPIPLVEPVLWPCSLSLIPDIGKVEITLQKKFPQIWHDVTNPRIISPEEVICEPLSDLKSKINREEISEKQSSKYQLTYQPLKVMNIFPVNHDSKLFLLKHINDECHLIPIGYHVLLQGTVEGANIERNYTPIIPALHSEFWPSSVPSKGKSNGPLPPDMEGNWLCLLIKSTERGVLSPWLCDGGVNVGDTLMISECIAPTAVCEHMKYPPPFHMGRSPILESSSAGGLELLLLAAGTGVTPMVRIIQWALQIPTNQCKKATLMFFNKTEKDIIWRDQLDKLMADCDRFTAKHVLSNASSGWKEDRGIIRHDLLEPYFTMADGNSPSELSQRSFVYTCICGPIPFTLAAEKILLDLGVKAKDIFSFLG